MDEKTEDPSSAPILRSHVNWLELDCEYCGLHCIPTNARVEALTLPPPSAHDCVWRSAAKEAARAKGGQQVAVATVTGVPTGKGDQDTDTHRGTATRGHRRRRCLHARDRGPGRKLPADALLLGSRPPEPGVSTSLSSGPRRRWCGVWQRQPINTTELVLSARKASPQAHRILYCPLFRLHPTEVPLLPELSSLSEA